MDSLQIVAQVVGLIIAITIHEYAHAWTADHFGDPTPRSYGRLSLNPLRHLDPLGTLMLVFVHFGWGKPVPIDPYNLSKKEESLVAISGAVSNLVLAVIISLIIHLLPLSSGIIGLLFFVMIMNINLAIFNLLPIPPLDGSKLFLNLLPEDKSVEWQKAFDQYGYILLAALLFLPVGNSNIINLVITPIITTIIKLLGFS